MVADDERDLGRVLALYRSCCEQSGIEPLDEDVAREHARALTKLLVPAFEVTFRQHRSAPDRRQKHARMEDVR